MPKGLQRQKRPANVICAAVTVTKIATGKISEPLKPNDPAAGALGKLGGAKGGRARAVAPNCLATYRKRARTHAWRVRSLCRRGTKSGSWS